MNNFLTPNKLLRWLPMEGTPGGAPSLHSLIDLMVDLFFVQCLALLADTCWWKQWGKHNSAAISESRASPSWALGRDFHFHVMEFYVIPTFSSRRSFQW